MLPKLSVNANTMQGQSRLQLKSHSLLDSKINFSQGSAVAFGR